MLILPKAVYARRKQLWADSESGKLTDEALYQACVELEPTDYIGLVGIGKACREAGDFAGAQEYYWRAIQANPAGSEAYVDLARVLYLEPESRALGLGLCELGVLKKSREPGDEDLPDSVVDEPITPFLPLGQADEPPSVTERLRPLRMIEELQQGELATETVDAIISEGAVMVPLLVGILRAWAQDLLDEDNDVDLENALALLGEIGSPNEIPHLLEFVDLENEIAAGASEWALERIVERNPQESAKLAASLMPGLGFAQRLKLVAQTLRCAEFDPAGKLLERAGQNLESMSEDHRDSFFPMLVLIMLAARGREGIALARAALRRESSLLSRRVRRECEAMLVGCEEDGIPPNEGRPAAPTIYEICAGEIAWGDEFEDEGDEEPEDEYLPAPEPIRRKATPGRNDPCWCNSGKKYKKCHLDSDARGENDFNSLRKNIGEFLRQVLPQRESKQALAEFFGDGPQETNSEIMLIDWMIHDRISPSLGRTVLEEYLERRQRLTPREREMVEAWSRSHTGLYEVQSLKAGVGVELKDLIFGGTFFAHDVSMSTRLTKWDGLLTRVVPGERGTELASCALTVPRMHLQTLREWLDADHEESGLSWQAYLKSNWPRIRRQSREIAANWRENLQLANTDGEELLISKAVYTLVDEVATIGTMQLSSEFEDASPEDEIRVEFVWLNPEKTVLGNIRIEGGQLTLECNSKERLERGKRLILNCAGKSVRHLRDEFTTQKELKRQMEREPRTTPKSDIPKDLSDKIITRATEEHYAKWPDMHLPALDGKTPREAAKTPKGRKELTELLKSIENGEDRKRQSGESFYDVDRLRAELGIKE